MVTRERMESGVAKSISPTLTWVLWCKVVAHDVVIQISARSRVRIPECPPDMVK